MGRIIRVGPNLWLALQRLRLGDERRVVWIDAICIDQEDTLELSNQVVPMGLIYSQTEQVVVCLGVETKGSHDAVAFLQKIGLPRWNGTG